ncbi:hypothetical protein FGG08_006577 [Glutinoglossum americanum]|uniref:Uncharacterized protein n=1 Tax=Glutinoglossum americanum TaxID=1670608 RepID=A0A9P8I372_9PEZI|nr:hypothetical protein FGG08_006577 [Glutinoglossum americanum]
MGQNANRTDRVIAVNAVTTACNANNIGSTIDTARSAASAVGSAVPTIKIMASSFFAKAKYITSFTGFVTTAGVVAHFLQARQGVGALKDLGLRLEDIKDELAAQTSLQAPEMFAKHVHNYLRMRIEETKGGEYMHCFFVYHPDTDWHPAFFSRIGKEPLPSNFCGMSENLDALCTWMQFLRPLLARTIECGRDAVFHILIPAYRPLVVRAPLGFPEELRPLTIEGQIHSSAPRVWFNVPNAEPGLLQDVANLAQPPSQWQNLGAFFGWWKEIPPRILGRDRRIGDRQDINEEVIITEKTRRIHRRRRRHSR